MSFSRTKVVVLVRCFAVAHLRTDIVDIHLNKHSAQQHIDLTMATKSAGDKSSAKRGIVENLLYVGLTCTCQGTCGTSIVCPILHTCTSETQTLYQSEHYTP
jgi:hypothetical protein